MATVAKSRNTWFLLAAMLILISTIFAAGFISTCDTCRATDIQLTLREYTLYANLTLFDTTIDIEHEGLGTLQDSYTSAQLGDTVASYDVLEEEDLDLESLFDKINVEAIKLENAEIYFYYYKTTYDAASGKPASELVEIEDCYPSYTDAGGVANCTIPEPVYKDTCNTIYASFCNPENPTSDFCQQAKPSNEEAYVCGGKNDSIARLSAILKDKLSLLPAPICFISIILGGLLLASMFFSGRSPLSLLDITTPLLPKAKSISYGGISMGTGITRMGRAADMMISETEKASAATFHELTRFYRQSTGFNARLLGMILDSNASQTMKMIALRALIAGRGENEVRRVLGLKIGGYKDKAEEKRMLEELGKEMAFIKSRPNPLLRASNNLEDKVISNSEQRLLIEMQRMAVGSATGGGTGIKKVVAKTLGRLPVIGDHFRGFTASALFGAKQVKTLYSAFGKSTVRTAMGRDQMERIQMAVDAERARGRKAGGFAGWIALSEDEKNLVTLFNIYEKGDALFKRKIEEAKNDLLNWLIRKILEGYGARLDLNEEQVLQIGPRGPNELMFGALRARALAGIEGEIRAILMRELSQYQKAELLMQLMARERVQFDRAGILAAISNLRRIETEVPRNYRDAPAGDGYLNQEAVLNSYRLIRLQKYLEEQFKVNQHIDINREFGNRFFFTVGRPDLKYVRYDQFGNMEVIDHTFGTYFLSKYRQSLESTKPGDRNPASLMDVANFCFLRIVNERWGLMDPNTPGLSSEVKIVMQRAREWLISLANPGIFRGIPSMKDLTDALYASDVREIAPGKKYDKDALKTGSHGFEYGPVGGIWRMDMKAHWRTLGGGMGGARTSVENQSYKEAYHSHMMPKAVAAIMDEHKTRGTPISQERAMEIYFRQVTARNLLERMKGIIELDAPNAYFSSQKEFDHFHSILGAYKEYIARKQGRREFEITDREVEKLIAKPIGIKELGDDSWIRLREGAWVPFSQKYSFKLAQADRVVNSMAYVKQDGVWKEFLPEKLLTDGLFRKKMRPLGEFDEITPASNEVLKRYHALLISLGNGTAGRGEVDSFVGMVADFARSEAKDSRKGMAYASILTRLAREDTKITQALEALGVSIENHARLAGTAFGESIKGGILAQRYMGARDAQDRDAAVRDLKAWANSGSPQDNRQMRLALLFYNQGNRMNDMKEFNSYEEGIRIAPMGMKSFTTEVGGRQVTENIGGIRNWLRQAFKPLNMELEQFTLSAFAKQTRAEYESSIVSEYYRETGAKFAGKLIAGEFGHTYDRDSPAMRTYNSLADSFGRYHAIWDETITRDPRGNSSAIGHSFIFSSYFHHGPGMPFGPAFYQRWINPGMNAPFYSKDKLMERFRFLQMTPQMFNWMLAGPFIGGYRTFLTSKFGYPSKYDRNYITRETEQSNTQYRQASNTYNAQLSPIFQTRLAQIAPGGHATAEQEQQARNFAAQELRAVGIVEPQKPQFVLERDTMNPFEMSTPRDKDSWRALSNWFYASFDPTSTNLKRNLARLFSPVTAFIPSTWVHGKVLGKEWHFADSFNNPYYVSPGGVRGEMIKQSGPMIKRQYGGTEMLTGVVRAPEDMWAFHSGVNVIWGNANPGMSYVDFSNTLQMDPRAANYLRYESRFRPYFSHDQYIDKQANLGIAKREIDPTRMMLERNQELRGYRFPENRLYQFLNPATFVGYKAASYAKRVKNFFGDSYDFAEGLATYDGSNRGVGIYGGYAAARGLNFLEKNAYKVRTKFTTELRYCSCGSAMPADGVCPACSMKTRCPHCGTTVPTHQTHTCQHGLRRNLLMDEMQKDGVWKGMDVWKNMARGWGRDV